MNQNAMTMRVDGYEEEKAAVVMACIKEHGFPPMTRKIAAAHEAGHVIVADAVGLPPIIHTYIQKEPIAHELRVLFGNLVGEALPAFWWVGWTAWGDATETLNDLSAHELLQRLLFTLGGWAGERAIGKAHPSSCVDERLFYAFQYGVFAYKGYYTPTADHEAVAAWTLSLIARVEGRALQIIRKRRHLFDRLRKKLYQCKRLEGDQLAPFRIGTMEGWDRDLIPPVVH